MNSPQSRFSPAFNAAFKSGRYMKTPPELHALSLSSVMLQMFFKEQILAKGTGWFWRVQDGIALTTAWHNLSGLHHTRRAALSPQGGIPDRIRFRFMTKNPQTFQETEVPLYLDDALTQPRWYVHPVCGSYFDMAFILLDITGPDLACVNDFVPMLERKLQPAFDVFAIGYPQGINMLNVFPVWKRGSIASDPDLLVEGHPKFFIDMGGRGGLSGAAVYRIQRGVMSDETSNSQSVSFGERTEFIGLYSGRAADQLPLDARSGESSDLGFVWRSDVVNEMLNARTLDEQPEVGKGAVEIEPIWQPRAP